MGNQQHISAEFQVKLTNSPQTVEAGKSVNLKFSIEQDGQVVPLDVFHEMKIHLLAVDEDLTWFCHAHPVEQKDGIFTLTQVFPHGGKFFLFADFKPSGAEQTVKKLEILVKGKTRSNHEEISSKLVSEVSGYIITLENGSNFKTNRTQPLEVSVEENGKKMHQSDLQQFLGAFAHIVMIRKVGKEFLHIHSISERNYPIYAETHIEKSGIYRMWIQFKVAQQVHIADFTVEVTEGKPKDDGKNPHHAHDH